MFLNVVFARLPILHKVKQAFHDYEETLIAHDTLGLQQLAEKGHGLELTPCLTGCSLDRCSHDR